MTAQELFDRVVNKAKEFGLIAKNDGRTIVEPKGNSIIRNNLLDVSFEEGSAYFGFLSSDEDTNGPYSDFSFVVFPDDKDPKTCVVALGVGSSGFRNDYSLASHPGLRRTFLKLKTEDDLSFFKTAFDDIESTLSDLVTKIRADYPALKNVIESYKTVLPACRIVSFESHDTTDETTGEIVKDVRTATKIEDEALNIIYTWLATYAKVRGWGTAAQKAIIKTYLDSIPTPTIPDDKKEIEGLLDNRHYVVLQGAPGTGKTYTALEISESKVGSKKRYGKTFFEQFHAETTYSDFVYGLEPNTGSSSGSMFKQKEGILYKAIKYALDNDNEKVLLIIDEINRANLSNVLGPVFYLFEYQSGARSTKIKLGDLELSKLPSNLDVIATMNTADRSLAVVDFALRRRFAWYTLRPHKVSPGSGKKFMEKIYNRFADLFYEFATDDELNLQPGQSYFIVESSNKDEIMKDRLIYELMPLIKEYLAEGYMLKAKDSFCDLFLKETGKLMYE